MSFQEFASNLFGSRKKTEKKVRNAKDVKQAEKQMSGPFSGTLSNQLDDMSKVDDQEDLERAQELFQQTEGSEIKGSVDPWLAEKKLNKDSRKERRFEDKVIISGEKEAETDDAVLITNDDVSGLNEKQGWFPKSEFDEFESSGPKLSESKEEKAENIMESRSERAQRTDRRNAAPIAEDFEEWKKDPSETDLPGIDTLGSGSDDLDDLF